MKTVIFSHPWDGSFNKAILDQVVKKLDETKEKYTVIDLNKNGFNPATQIGRALCRERV